MGLYEKAMEAIGLLATPPNGGDALSPDALRSLLGERLDAICTLARKVTETTAALRESGRQ